MTEQVEQDAMDMGWLPEDKYTGDPAKWVDAETFVKRGEEVLPIMKANNRKLLDELRHTKDEVSQLKTATKTAQDAIDALREASLETTKLAVQRARAEIIAELKIAKESGNVEQEVALTEQLAELRSKPKTPPATQPEAPVVQSATDPALIEWQAQNKWFGTDTRKTSMAMGIAQLVRSDPENDSLVGKAFYDKVDQMIAEQTRPASSKVGEARTTSASSGGGSKAYRDLPADAKQVCERQATRLVGEGKAFKTLADWQKHYVELYYQG